MRTAKSGVTRAVASVISLLMVFGGALVAPSATAAGSADLLLWIGQTSGSNKVWSSTPSTVSSATSLPSGSPITGTYRSLATDGTYLYFSDGTDLVRTALDGTGKTTVVAGVASPEQIVVTGGRIYYSRYTSGIWVVSATSPFGTPTNILGPSAVPSGYGASISSSGFDGLAIIGSTLYSANYLDGLYRATLNGTNIVTGLTVNANARTGVTKLLAVGSTLYAAGSSGKIPYTTDPTQALSSWTYLNTATVAGSPYSLANAGSTIYYTVGTKVASIGTNDTGNVELSGVSQFETAWSIVAIGRSTVSYSDTGKTSGSAPVDSSSPYVDGTNAIVLGNTGNLVKTGYQFYAWNDGSNNYSPGSTYTVSQNTTFSPTWLGGPLLFSLSPGGPAITTTAFPDTVVGQSSSLTIYVRNSGTAVTPNAIASFPAQLSVPSTTCGNVATVYAAGSECVMTVRWSPTSVGSIGTAYRSFNYGIENKINFTGTAVQASRVPTFDTPVSTADGFTVNVTNWDASWTWTPTVSTGSVTAGIGSGSSLALTVSGVSPGTSVPLTVTTARSGYADGSSMVTGSSLPSSGGGGGGSAPEVSEIPSPTANDTTIVTPTSPQPLGPSDPTAVSKLTPGKTYVSVAGNSIETTSTSSAPRGTVTTSGDGWSVTVGGRKPAGPAQPLGSAGAIQIPRGGSIAVSGSGYEPGTAVVIYAMTPAIQLGTLIVGPDGTFQGTVAVPGSLTLGRAVIQVNGYSPGMLVRSLSTGVRIVPTSAVQTTRLTVQFREGSSRLTPEALTQISEFAASVPKKAKSIRVVSVGYVQGTPDTSNDVSLSTARAQKVADQLKRDGLRGTYLISGRGVAKEKGPEARKVIVTVTYRR